MSPSIDKKSKKNGQNAEKIESNASLSECKLNPLAKEFVPAYRVDQRVVNNFNQPMENDGYNWRANDYTQRRERYNRKNSRSQREDVIRRTVYVSHIDSTVSEQELASVFIPICGNVVDCRICGDPRSQLRFGFVEFADERAVKKALELCGVVLGYYAIRVEPSKTAILPVNPIFLPRSYNEQEMVTRTVYCSNIDKAVSYPHLRYFFEQYGGEVTRLRLLGDYVHTTRIAFIEFATAESAIMALYCSGAKLGMIPIRVSPSKTPLRTSSHFYADE